MRHVTVFTLVHAPAPFSIAFLRGYLGDAAGLALERDVTVQVDSVLQTGVDSAQLSLRWEPTGTSRLPRFDGIIAAEALGAKTSSLCIRGKYEPPLGASSAVFDPAAGAQITQATIDGLMRELCTAIELDYTRETP